jgi:Prolyl oligopeptidase family
MMAGQRRCLRGEAIRACLADTGRLGLFGLSHGGFATGWLVATSGRFKAGMADGLTGRPCGR